MFYNTMWFCFLFFFLAEFLFQYKSMQFVIQVVMVPKKRCFCSYRCIDIFVVQMIIQKMNLLFLRHSL